MWCGSSGYSPSIFRWKGLALKPAQSSPGHRKEPLFSTSYSLEQSWPIFLTLIRYISAIASRNWQRVVDIYLYYIYCKMLIHPIAAGVPDTGIVSFSFMSWRMWCVKLSALAFFPEHSPCPICRPGKGWYSTVGCWKKCMWPFVQSWSRYSEIGRMASIAELWVHSSRRMNCLCNKGIPSASRFLVIQGVSLLKCGTSGRSHVAWNLNNLQNSFYW